MAVGLENKLLDLSNFRRLGVVVMKPKIVVVVISGGATKVFFWGGRTKAKTALVDNWNNGEMKTMEKGWGKKLGIK